MNLTGTVCSICIYFYHLAEAARRLYQQPRIVQKCHTSSWYRVWAGHPGCSCCSQGGNSRWILGTELYCHSCHSSLWDWVKNMASESSVRALPSLQLLCWKMSSCVWFSWNVQLPEEFAVTVFQSKMEWVWGSIPWGLQGLSLQSQELQSENLTFVLVTTEWILNIFRLTAQKMSSFVQQIHSLFSWAALAQQIHSSSFPALWKLSVRSHSLWR